MPERWLVYALLSALAAAFVPILGKLGLRTLDPTLATAIRSIAMTIVLLIAATAMNAWGKWPALRDAGWKDLTVLALSGIAGAISWIFYFGALQLTEASRVAPIDKLSMPLAVLLAVILLQERPSALNWVGIGLIAVGAFFAAAK